MILDSKIPAGPLDKKWTNHKFEIKLINPANKRKFHVLVVGTGLAGASGLGQRNQDFARPHHDIAASGIACSLGLPQARDRRVGSR